MKNIYGYIRVSSRDQNEDRQMLIFQELAIPAKNVFIDKQSGKDFDRPAYKRMVRRMKKDDLLSVMQAYGFSIKDTAESSCVAELMKLYQRKISENIN